MIKVKETTGKRRRGGKDQGRDRWGDTGEETEGERQRGETERRHAQDLEGERQTTYI
jgi:hypothetical protein